MSGPGASTSIGDAAPDWPGRGVQGDRGPQGLPGRDGVDADPAELLGGLAPGEALTVDDDGRPASLGLVVSRDQIAPEWAVVTRYSAGDIIHRQGRALRVLVDHTTGATVGSFDPTKYEDLHVSPDGPVWLMLPSSDAGGDDFDSTGRITLESWQRPEHGPWGEVLRMINRAPQAKTMQAWYSPIDPSAEYDPASNPISPIADVWVGAHYAGQTDGTGIHGHWSVETPMASGSLHSRFGIDWIDQATKQRGADVTHTYIANSHFTHRQGDGAVFRIASGAGSAERRIEFSAAGFTPGESPGYVDETKRRWWVVVDQSSESTGNAGSNFAIRRFADDGTSIPGVALFIARKTGNVTLGEAADQDAKLTARWAGGSAHGFRTAPTATPSSGFAHYSATAFAAADRVLDVKVAGDTVSRWVTNSNGKQEFGNGTDARDCTLERLSAKVLGTGAGNAWKTGVVATGSRPSAASVGQGSQMYDSTLNQPIWSTGSAWVDAMGQPV